MRLAIATHETRVSPVLDVARRLLVVDLDGVRETSRREVVLDEASLPARARSVRELDIEVLICGAISRPLEAALVSTGIRVIPQVCGPIDEVLAAFLAGHLADAMYLMPGCCGRRGRYRGGHGSGRPRPGGPERGQ